MSKHLAMTALVTWMGLAATATIAAAQDSARPAAAPAYALTPKRAVASLSVLVAVTGAVIGGQSLARAAGRTGAAHARHRTIIALVLGSISLAGGGFVVATAQGGLGTGSGVAGGVVAITMGLIGMTLGWLALARLRQAG